MATLDASASNNAEAGALPQGCAPAQAKITYKYCDFNFLTAITESLKFRFPIVLDISRSGAAQVIWSASWSRR
jgi:hypothetical protein